LNKKIHKGVDKYYIMEKNVATYLGQKGYTIKKENMEISDQIELRNDLMVKPFVPKTSMVKPESFPIYRESKNKFYIPRFYGIDTYGNPEANLLKSGKDIDLEFNGELRDFQKPIVNAYLKHAKTKGSGLLELFCGGGKCILKGTPIMLSNGKIKKVENIKVGDKLMGDDSTPRTVLSLARGREMMYDIIPTKGDKYTVNESHILSLRCMTTVDKTVRKDPEAEKRRKNQKYKKDKIIDIGVKDFLKLPKSYQSMLKGYRVPIHFPEKKVDLDPYVLGYWLGDGNSNVPAITTEDEPVVEYFRYYCEDLGLKLHQSKDSETTRHSLHYRMSGNGRKGSNPMTNMLRKYNLIMNKHIPHIYKCNSKDIQLELLAGIIDSDGSLAHGGYDIIQKNERLLDDIIFLARSLGFAAYKNKCEKSCMYKGEKKTGTYYRTNIHGEGVEYIPVKVERKKANKRKQIKNVLNTGIRVVKREVDEYYGFEIDGNRRFVLGDFTVTHNTVLGLNIISKLKKKTLIVVHKEFLVRQWIERIEQFLPKARVGKIQASVIDIEDKDIVIGMLQSLSMKEYDQSIFNEFGFAIFDESHHLAPEVFSRAMFKIVTPYALGLSATMKRKDGLTKVIKMFLGEVVYKMEREKEDNVVVKAINYYLEDEEFLELKLNFRQQINYAAMMKKLCELNHRREFILKVLEDLVETGAEDTQIMVLGHYKTILTYIYEAIKHRGIATVGYYIGGMNEVELKKSEGKKIIIATYAMAEEGLDIKTLTTLVMATPKSDVTQAVGRILRKKRDESLVIDIVDPHIIFQKQYMKRKRFYKKQNFQLKETDIDGYYKDEWETRLTNKKSTKKSTKNNSPFMNGVCLIKDDD
jgi:superfamily II DNA or RNA helicase